MRKVVFASHGNFASGLKDAVSLIVGDMANDILTYDLLPGGTADVFAKDVISKTTNEEVDEIIVLTDLKGASVCNAFTLISNDPNIHVFSGMNLPIALDVLLSYQSKLSSNDINQIVENGRLAISYIELEEVESEEF